MPSRSASCGDSICDRLAVDKDLALVGALGARENLHQRRFAGAVFADESEHFAREQGERDAVERAHARKLFAMPRISSSGAVGRVIERAYYCAFASACVKVPTPIFTRYGGFLPAK